MVSSETYAYFFLIKLQTSVVRQMTKVSTVPLSNLSMVQLIIPVDKVSVFRNDDCLEKKVKLMLSESKMLTKETILAL